MMTITILILLLQQGWNGYLLDDDLLLVLKPTILVAINITITMVDKIL